MIKNDDIEIVEIRIMDLIDNHFLGISLQKSELE